MVSSFNSKDSFISPSYSKLLENINEGNVKSLILVPTERVVYAKYLNGTNAVVSVFPNDQTILRTAELAGIPLTVKNITREKAAESFTANFTVSLLFILFVLVILRKVLNIAGKSLSFLAGKTSFIDTSLMDTRFVDIAGIPEAVEEVKEIVSFLTEPDKFIKIGATIPKGFLLIGPPGTGKTLLAKAIACEANVPFLSISASEFVELFVGIGASRVKNLFFQAKEKSPSIVFIDEIDSIGRKRGTGLGGGNDEREQTLNQLLAEMDGFQQNSGIIVIAATNRQDILDTALTRPGRFDRIIEVSLPDRKGRHDILSIHALTKPLDDQIIINDIALKTQGFSGAELKNLLNEAAIIAARNNKKRIGNNEIDQAIDRLSIGITIHKNKKNTYQKLIAYNEVGRALVSYFTPITDTIDKITILNSPRNLGGFTRFTPSDDVLEDNIISKKYLISKIIIALGGRATEELVFGNSELSQLSMNHLIEATKIARMMIIKYGFSSTKYLSINSQHNQDNLTENIFRRKPLKSEKTSSLLDLEVIELLKNSLVKAKALLKPHLSLIDELAEKLLLEETISGKSFVDYIQNKNI